MRNGMRRDILRETQAYKIYCKPLSLKKTKKFTTACRDFLQRSPKTLVMEFRSLQLVRTSPLGRQNYGTNL
jgi:hypothetical protein